MRELINVTEHKRGDREFVRTVERNFASESVKQGSIIKIIGKSIEGVADNVKSEDD